MKRKECSTKSQLLLEVGILSYPASNWRALELEKVALKHGWFHGVNLADDVNVNNTRWKCSDEVSCDSLELQIHATSSSTRL